MKLKLLTNKQTVLLSVIGSVAGEILTAFLRFVVGIQSTRDFASTIGVITFGIRVHHSYLGVVILVTGIIMLKKKPALARWMLVVGISLIVSDLLHHFAVLWPIVGRPEFDLVY